MPNWRSASGLFAMTEPKLKIAISIWCFKPETGGLQAYAEQLCWELQRRGHDVFVVTRAATRVPQGRDYLFFNERAPSLSVKNIPVRPLRFARGWRPVLWLLGKFVVRPRFQAAAVQLYKLVSRKPARLAFRDVDLIHHISEASPLNGFAAAAAAKHWGIPFVVSPTCHPHHVGDSPLDLRLYRQADRLLVYTEYEAQYLREKLAGCAIDVVGIGIEDRSDGSAEQFRDRTGIAGPFILFIGRKDPQKGYPLLIDAFRLVRRQRPEFSLVCMGPAGSATMPKDVDGVFELDFTSDEVKHDALAACTCLCVPSDAESFGLVYMEAGRYGKPAIGRKMAVLEELLHNGVAAVLLGIPDDAHNRAILSPEALASGLLKLLADPKECQRIGESCRAVSEQFLWPHVIKRFEASYYQAVEDFKKHRPRKH
jgi:glycosyltransferase involved in cell wall biosynthesis